MKVDDKFQILKFFAAVFNSVFLILGLCIFGCAVWILFDKDNFIAVLSSVEVKTIAGGLFIIGLVVVGVTILGCVGAQLENRCFLLLYMGFLFCIVLGQLFVSFIILLKHGKITSEMEMEVNKTMTEYGTNPDYQRHWKLLDNVQHYGRCCGLQGPNDWQGNMFIKNTSLTKVYPCSCFNTTDCPAISGYSTPLFGNGNETHIHPQGCGVRITNWLKENTWTIVGMDVGLFIIQVLQFIVAVYLYQTVGQKAKLRNVSQLICSEDHHKPNPDYLDDPDQNYAYSEPNQAYAHTNPAYPEQILAYPEQILAYPETRQAYSDDQHQASSGPNNAYHR